MSDIKEFTPLWGNWETESLIGEGSFGKVYKATRKDFGRIYHSAIKHISLPQSDAEVKRLLEDHMSDNQDLASNYYKQIVEDINNEIAIMHSLQGNTNIVTYEDHLIIPKTNGIGYDIFIRMELLVGLSERVKQSEFTEDDAVRMGTDILTALEVCAAKSLIHRDIKPQNVFVNPEGRYKLGDFGISRQLEKTTSGLSKKGTYSYMAPEVYKGQDYGANVDIYSLGLLMYRLLNGNRLPFLPLAPNPVRYDDNEKALARRMTGEDMPAPAFASKRFSGIILKMCAFDRDERYKTATEAKNDLLHIVKGSLKTIPMVAPVGTDSLTDEPAPSSSLKTKSAVSADDTQTVKAATTDGTQSNEKTASMFTGVSYAPPNSNQMKQVTPKAVPAMVVAPSSSPISNPIQKLVAQSQPRPVWPWVLGACVLVFILFIAAMFSHSTPSMWGYSEELRNSLKSEYDFFNDFGDEDKGKYSTGVYEVGVGKDIKPGLYFLEGSQTLEGSFKLFKKEKDGEYYLGASIVYFGNYLADLKEGELIDFWAPEDSQFFLAPEVEFDALDIPYKSGCYRVGIDIPAGTYRVTAQPGALDIENLSGEPAAIIMDDLDWNEDSIVGEYYVMVGESHTITLEEGQILELYQAEMTPTTVSPN